MDKQGLELNQRIGQRLSQAQIRYVKLLELNAPELDEAVSRELDDNPALTTSEESSSDEERQMLTDDGEKFTESAEQMQKSDYLDADDIPAGFGSRFPRDGFTSRMAETPQADDAESLYDNLNRQVDERKLPPLVAITAHYIVNSLDSNGYLRRPLTGIVDDMAFGPGVDVDSATAREALDIVRSLDPPGIGASDLQDCLTLQLEAMPESAPCQNALRIIRQQFQAFTMKHTHKIISTLKLTQREVDEAMELILSLNPKPGSALGSGASDTAATIIPDIVIDNSDGEISIALNNSIPDLRIEQSFARAVAEMQAAKKKREARKGKEFIMSRFNDARDFIRIIRQRQRTLLSVMTAIVDIQKEYFQTEDIRSLKPMMIKDIAKLTGLDISVISRATANKFAATPWGIFPLRFFFSDAYTAPEGEDYTPKVVEQELKKIVESEDSRHPLSDEKLREELKKRGYDISRRTVAKYRDRCHIPESRMRKKM